MKEPVRYAAILFIFCAISAGLLAYVNSLTEPVIAQAELESTMQSYEDIFGEKSTSLEPLDEAKLATIKEKYTAIEDVFVAKNGEEVVGYGINVSANGYGGSMTNAIGILNDDTIAGFRNISNGETKGIGSQIEEEFYYSTYEGKSASAPLVLSSSPLADNEVLSISGATVSSKGVIAGSNEAINAYNEFLKGGESN